MKKSTAAQLYPIDQYMTPSPHTVRADASIADAQRLMRDGGIRHLPVIDPETHKLVGITTERDLLMVQALRTVDLDRTRVDRAMQTDVYGVDRDTPLDEVAATMASHRYGSAVVWSGGEIVGIFTNVDANRTLSGLVRKHKS